jgi:hypothetical protein
MMPGMKQWIKYSAEIVAAVLAGFLIVRWCAKPQAALPQSGSCKDYYYFVSGNDMAGWVPQGG